MKQKRPPPSVRQFVIERDGSTCQICSLNLRPILDLLEDLRRDCEEFGRYSEAAFANWERAREVHRRYGFQGSPLHIDHIVPRADGGTDEPDNLRVLCCHCHNELSALYNQRRNREQRHTAPQRARRAVA